MGFVYLFIFISIYVNKIIEKCFYAIFQQQILIVAQVFCIVARYFLRNVEYYYKFIKKKYFKIFTLYK